jgi:hypothetical protein
MYAGTCTPSCAIIKLFKEQIKREIFPVATDTLWGALVNRNVPRYTAKQYDKNLLSSIELDMTTAFLAMCCERFISSPNKWGVLDELERNCVKNQFNIEITRTERAKHTLFLNKLVTQFKSDDEEGVEDTEEGVK